MGVVANVTSSQKGKKKSYQNLCVFVANIRCIFYTQLCIPQLFPEDAVIEVFTVAHKRI